MELIKLTEDNITDYAAYIGEDVAENIGRIYFRGILAVEGDAPVGGMIWQLRNMQEEDNHCSNIVWLVCSDEQIAEALFGKYNEMIREADVAMSTFTLPAKTSKVEKQILKDYGFSVALTEGDLLTARLSELMAIGFVKSMKQSENIKAIRDITQRGFNNALRRIISMGHVGTCDDISYLSRSYFENDVSVYAEDDGVINGMLLCHKRPSGKVEVCMLASMDKNNVKLLPQLIAAAAYNASELYPPETEIIIDRHNYAALALGEKLFPRGFGVPVYTGSRVENGGA